MRRKLFNFSTAVLLVLCVAAAALWAYSYFATVVWNGRDRTPSDPSRLDVRHWTIRAHRGQVWYAWVDADHLLYVMPMRDMYQPDFVGLHTYSVQSTTPPLDLQFMSGWSFAGLQWVRNAGLGTGAVAFPLWLIVFISAAAPTLWIGSRYRRRRRLHAGLCPVCGYDLRATPNCCPECGATAAVATPTAA